MEMGKARQARTIVGAKSRAKKNRVPRVNMIIVRRSKLPLPSRPPVQHMYARRDDDHDTGRYFQRCRHVYAIRNENGKDSRKYKKEDSI